MGAAACDGLVRVMCHGLRKLHKRSNAGALEMVKALEKAGLEGEGDSVALVVQQLAQELESVATAHRRQDRQRLRIEQ